MSSDSSSQAIWLTWERQRRNRTMAVAVGAALHELHAEGSRLTRYWALTRRTVALIRNSNADVIYFQNPSIVLAVVVLGMKALGFTRAVVIGDFHNAGVFPPVGAILVPWLVRRCDLVIVSNFKLQARVAALGGRSIAVPDPLPTLQESGDREKMAQGPFRVLVICSWANDEPILNVLEAAEILQAEAPDVVLAISGRAGLARVGWTKPVPENVELTGFMTDEEFERRLMRSDVIMDLTTRADCMVCGAYEAVSAEVPLIASENEPTVRYFSKGAVFTNNTSRDIARAVVEVLTRRADLEREVKELKAEILHRERAVLQDVRDAARLLSGRTARG